MTMRSRFQPRRERFMPSWYRHRLSCLDGCELLLLLIPQLSWLKLDHVLRLVQPEFHLIARVLKGYIKLSAGIATTGYAPALRVRLKPRLNIFEQPSFAGETGPRLLLRPIPVNGAEVPVHE